MQYWLDFLTSIKAKKDATKHIEKITWIVFLKSEFEKSQNWHLLLSATWAERKEKTEKREHNDMHSVMHCTLFTLWFMVFVRGREVHEAIYRVIKIKQLSLSKHWELFHHKQNNTKYLLILCHLKWRKRSEKSRRINLQRTKHWGKGRKKNNVEVTEAEGEGRERAQRIKEN